ncbi:MAG: hypothetical protein RL329_3396 [Bacteroidota bacterium]
MQNQTFQLEIATPCAEPLDQMAPHPQGFYCHTCKHKVIDFTEKLPSEIAQFFTKHAQDDICGRFYDHQLEEDKCPFIRYARESKLWKKGDSIEPIYPK